MSGTEKFQDSYKGLISKYPLINIYNVNGKGPETFLDIPIVTIKNRLCAGCRETSVRLS